MTDKARELLERAADSLDGGLLYRLRLKEEIRAYLSEPEVKRGALSEEELEKVMIASPEDTYFTGFISGVRFAEKHHGIEKNVREETPD